MDKTLRIRAVPQPMSPYPLGCGDVFACLALLHLLLLLHLAHTQSHTRMIPIFFLLIFFLLISWFSASLLYTVP
jgi:hypothetical protein